MSRILCKQQRGDLLALGIQVIEEHIENSFHTLVISKDTHRSGSPHYFAKSPFYEVRGPDLLPQSHLSFVPVQLIQPLLLVRRENEILCVGDKSQNEEYTTALLIESTADHAHIHIPGTLLAC
jgi:hypothetical protein